jgi:hypothetical protein
MNQALKKLLKKTIQQFKLNNLNKHQTYNNNKTINIQIENIYLLFQSTCIQVIL